MASHDIAHGTAIQFITQFEQLALNLVKTHARILACQADNQVFQFSIDPRASTDVRSLERPFAAYEVSMPLQQGVWLDQEYALPQTENAGIPLSVGPPARPALTFPGVITAV